MVLICTLGIYVAFIVALVLITINLWQEGNATGTVLLSIVDVFLAIFVVWFIGKKFLLWRNTK